METTEKTFDVTNCSNSFVEKIFLIKLIAANDLLAFQSALAIQSVYCNFVPNITPNRFIEFSEMMM